MLKYMGGTNMCRAIMLVEWCVLEEVYWCGFLVLCQVILNYKVLGEYFTIWISAFVKKENHEIAWEDGKLEKKINPGPQISQADFGMLVSGENGCLLWCWSGFNIFGNVWDRGYVKMGGRWYISSEVCSWKSMGLKWVEKLAQISSIYVVGVW